MISDNAQNEIRFEKKRKISILVLLLVTLLAVALPLAAIVWFGGLNDEYYLSKARRALEQGNYPKAVEYILSCHNYEETADLLTEAVKDGTSKSASGSQKHLLDTSDLEKAVVFIGSGGFSDDDEKNVETAVMNAGEAAFRRMEFDYAKEVFEVVKLGKSTVTTRAAAYSDAVSGIDALEKGEYKEAERLLRSARTFAPVKPYYETACRELVLEALEANDLELVTAHVKTQKTVEIDEEIHDEILAAAARAHESGDPTLAKSFLYLLPAGSYDESFLVQLEYDMGVQYYDAGDYASAERCFLKAASIDGADEMYKKSHYARALEYSQNGDYYKAIQIFEELGDYENAQELIVECNYLQCVKYAEIYYVRYEGLDEEVYVHFSDDRLNSQKSDVLKKYDTAIEFFEQHPGYRDSDELLKEVYYKKANTIAFEDPEAALALYMKIPDYKDVAEKTAEDSPLMRVLRVRKGDTVTFGRYYINNESDLEPITWRIVDVSEGCALLVSDRALTYSAYFSKEDEEKYGPDDRSLTMYRYIDRYNSRADVYKYFLTFARSTASRYLNGEFSDTAFTEEEKACITRKGDANVFLLNRYQAEKYFYAPAARVCGLTPFAEQSGIESGVSQGSVKGKANWLLSGADIGDNGITGVYYVSTNGQVFEATLSTTFSKYSVFALRPCVWVDAEKFMALSETE